MQRSSNHYTDLRNLMTAVFVPAGAFIQLRLDADKLPYEKSADGKGEPVCIAEEVPFELPKGWAWARLALLCDAILVPQRDKPKFFSGNIPWCRIEDIEGRLIYESRIGRCVDQATVESMNLKINPVGTVICSNSATIGVPAIVTKPLVTNQRFIGFVCRPQLLNWYLYDLFFSSA